MKKQISVFLVLVMLLGMLPLGTALAVYDEEQPGFFKGSAHDSMDFIDTANDEQFAYRVTDDPYDVDADTVWFVVPNGWTMTDVYVSECNNLGFDFEEVTSGYARLRLVSVGSRIENDTYFTLHYTAEDAQSAQHEGDCTLYVKDVTPRLMYRWASWHYEDDRPVWESSNDTPQTGMWLNPGEADYGFELLWRDEAWNLTPVDVADITFPTDIVTVTASEGAFVMLEAKRLSGYGEIQYQGSAIPVTVKLPSIGLYSATQATLENYLPEWVYTGSNKTVYLINTNGTFSEITDRRNSGASIKLSSDNTYAEITLDTPMYDSWLELQCSGEWTGGRSFSGSNYGFRFVNKAPGLVWRWADWEYDDDGNRIWLSTEQETGRGCSAEYGSYMDWEFLWRDADGKLPPVDAAALNIPTELMEFTQTDGAFAQLHFAEQTGEGEITYQGSAIHISLDLPGIGFYTAPQATQENYLGQWRFTDGNKTVYLVNRRGTLSEIEDMSELGAEITLSQDGTYATVTLPSIPGDQWFYLKCSGEWDGGRGFNGYYAGVEVRDCVPGLVWRWADWEYDDDSGARIWLSTDQNAQRAWSGSFGYYMDWEFLWRDEDGNLTPVDVAALDFPTELMEIGESDGAFAEIHFFEKSGEGEITYQGSAIHISLQLPELAFYSAPEATDQNYLSEWVYTGGNPTVYLINREGTFTEVLDLWNSGAEIKLSEDKTCAAVTLNSVEDLWWLDLSCSGMWNDGREFGPYYESIRIFDRTPGLAWRWAAWDNDAQKYVPNEGEETGKNSMSDSPGAWSAIEFFYRAADGALTPLTADQLAVDGSGISLSQYSGAITRLDYDSFGESAVTYQDGRINVKSVLPHYGFYSAPARTEETYISDWSYYGEPQTVYFIVDFEDDGIVFTEAASSNANVTAAIGTDGKYIEISPVDPALECGARITWTCSDGEGYSYSDTNYVNYHIQRMYLHEVFAPSSDYTVLRNFYSGIGRRPGSVEYIQPAIVTDGPTVPMTETLTSLDETIVKASLADAENHIWKLEFLKDGKTYLKATVDGTDYYISVAPQGDNTLPQGGVQMYFCLTIPPHNDYLPEDAMYTGFGNRVGTDRLFQFSTDNFKTVVTGGLTYESEAMTVEPVSGTGLEGVYRVTPKRVGAFTIEKDGLAVKMFGNMLFLELEKVEARSATASSDGNIEYYKDKNDDRYYVLPTYSLSADAPMTRADMARFVCEALGWTKLQPATDVQFTDVPADHADYHAIMLLTGMGILQGTGDGTFLPDASMTRAEAAAVLSRALRVGGGDAANAPEDVAADAWYYESVLAMLRLGVMPARADGSFAPLEPVTLGDFDLVRILTLTGYQEISKRDTVIPAYGDDDDDDEPAPSTPAPASTTTETTNEDGSVTTTTVNPDGSTVETTTYPDGSVTEKTTEADGSVTETTTDADGNTGTIGIDAEGNLTEASAAVSDEAAAAAAEDGAPITLPIEMEAAENAEDAVALTIEVSEEAGAVTVEIPVTDVDENSVVVLVHADGSEEILPRAALSENGLVLEVEGSVTVKIVDNAQSFGDVPADDESAEAIRFVAARGMMIGVGDDAFAPEKTMSRAMIATVLYRMERQPNTDAGAVFEDVAEGKWYTEAIAWAAEAGIVEGYGSSYGVNDDVTNEQLAVMLWRMSGRPAATPIETGAHSWGAEAMSWAIAVGLIEGDGTDPRAGATRADASVILMRYINLICA